MVYENAEYSVGSPIAQSQLIAGGTYTVKKVTVLSGENLPEGAVLGKITSGGKYVLSLSASGDGSEEPGMVLAQACDASAGDKEAMAFETCTAGLISSALTIGTGHTLASIREGLRVKGLPLSS